MTDEIEQDEARGVPGEDEASESPAGPVSVDEDEMETGAGRDTRTEVEDLRDELGELNDRHLRLAAEFDNYRKRNERDRQTLATRLQADLVSALLDVLDDLQRVEESADGGTKESLLEGCRLVEKKFMAVLESAGLEAVDAEGKPFDPEYMEALMTLPTDDPDQDGHVADVFQRGYLFRGAMVRPARVRVLQYEGSADGSE